MSSVNDDQTGNDPQEAPDYAMDPGAPAQGALSVNPDVDACPVIPLGFEGRNIWFALPEGEIRCEPAPSIARALETDVFASIAGQVFLSQWRGEDGKIKLQDAARWFVRACRALPRWDGSRPERGYGLWRDDDGLLLHSGDVVIRYRAGKKPQVMAIAQALRESGGKGPVWRLLAPTPRPPVKTAGLDVGQRFMKDLKRWNWRPVEGGLLTGPDIVAGWQMMAALGGAPPFRVILLLIGGRGTGKTTLMRYLQALNSANAGDLIDSFSEPGLRASLSGEARAVYLDEAEPHPSGEGPVEKALELLRRMATGEGASRKQADGRGGVDSQTAIGAVALGAINPPPMNLAMSSRLAEVRLRPLDAAKAGAEEEMEAMRVWAREISPALLGRAIAGAGRYRSDVAAIRAAMGEMMGSLPRQADLIAALAAGRRLLLFDEALDADGAKAEVELWAPLIEARAAEDQVGNEGQDCLFRILSVTSGKIANDRYMTLGELVAEEAKTPGFNDKVLKQFGLRVENGPSGAEYPGPWLFIANNHPTMQRAMRDTKFQNWRGVLEHLADMGDDHAPRPLKDPMRFGMLKLRTLAVPLTPWLEGPVGYGADRTAPTPFDPPEWHRDAPVSRDSSRSASHDGGVDA